MRSTVGRLAFALVLCAGWRSSFAATDDAAATELLDAFRAAHPDLARAAEEGDWSRVRPFLESSRETTEPVEHLFAGDIFFESGRLEDAYREHLASAKGALQGQGRFEATIDLLAMRRFPEACASYAQVPKPLAREPGLAALQAYMELRCGKPSEGLAQIRKVFEKGHSQGEEVLASVFSERKRFSFFKSRLEHAPTTDSGGVDGARALGELLLCGDFSNPWFPNHHESEAIAQFRKLLASRPEDCSLRARAAIGEMLRAGQDGQKTGPPDLSQARALLGPAFDGGPHCEEEAEAQYAYLDLTSGEDVKPLIAVLENAVQHYPANVDLHRYLTDRYREAGVESEHRAHLEMMVSSFPDDSFAYGRLALLDAIDLKDLASAVSWVQRGLARMPDSLPLNYLSALLRMRMGIQDT